jgi:hypothetical protein
MPNKLIKLYFIALFLVPWALSLYSQDIQQFMYLDDPVYNHLDYQINSGNNIPDFVLQQPFDLSVADSGKRGKAGKFFSRYWHQFYRDNEVSGQLNGADDVRYHDKIYNRFRIWGGVHFSTDHITLANRTFVNQDYKYDPKYAGDLSESENWIYGRVNDAYINLKYGGFNVFLGRMHRNWGPIGANSLILSNHPYTYDHFLFSYTYKILRFSMIVSRLEDLKAYELRKVDGEITEIKNARKYITGHRLDLSFSDKFQIALMEMAIYGGEGRDFEFAFLNPMNFYYGIQRNDKKQMSGLWNIDVFYKPWKQLTLYTQFLIDDIIVNNDPGVDDRARYPDRFGLMFSARTGDWLIPGLNLNLTYNRIWNRTYQSKFTYENYHYRELGLGFPAAGMEEIKLAIGYWGIFPFYFKNEFIYGQYGDVELTDIFPLKKEPFPIEPVTENMINTFSAYYFLSPLLRFNTKIYYYKEPNHYSNRINQFKGFAAQIGFELFLSGGVDL